MQINFYPGEFPEAVIVASPAEYAAMAGKIANLALVGTGELAFSAAVDSALPSLAVCIGTGHALVSLRSDGNLSILGNSEAIKLFGLNMPTEEPLPDGYHIHFEPSGREWFVAHDSVPLTIQVGRRRTA